LRFLWNSGRHWVGVLGANYDLMRAVEQAVGPFARRVGSAAAGRQNPLPAISLVMFSKNYSTKLSEAAAPGRLRGIVHQINSIAASVVPGRGQRRGNTGAWNR
jgi:hypothetical protein